jgi:hypothetical protein
MFTSAGVPVFLFAYWRRAVRRPGRSRRLDLVVQLAQRRRHAPNAIGFAGGKARRFPWVIGQLVEVGPIGLCVHQKLPVALAHRDLGHADRMAIFPVERNLPLDQIPLEGWKKARAIKNTVGRQLGARDRTERRYDVSAADRFTADLVRVSLARLADDA